MPETTRLLKVWGESVFTEMRGAGLQPHRAVARPRVIRLGCCFMGWVAHSAMGRGVSRCMIRSAVDNRGNPMRLAINSGFMIAIV